MIMLEDDLREMFGARVQAPLSPIDPAGAAIASGRTRRLRRRLLGGGIAAFVLAVMVTGLAVLKGIWEPGPGGDGAVSFEALYGPGADGGPAPERPMPIIDMPVDVHQGTALFTTDGRRLILPGVEQVIEVIRVPQGWLYSDDIQLRLLTVGGQTVPLRENIASWTVSDDGASVASVSDDSTLAVQDPAGGGQTKATPIPEGTRPTGFDGQRVVLGGEGFGADTWQPGDSVYAADTEPELMAVYTAVGKQAVGITRDATKTCLVDLVGKNQGWLIGSRLGCADLLNNAVQAQGGVNRAARSPDGRWLAVPSPTGVHLIDIEESRKAIETSVMVDGPPIFGYSCVSSPDAPAVWSDTVTVLTISSANGVVACKMNGSRFAVALPAGVSDGWGLVRRYGVNG
jgi:hypothetical protein